jgi:hypothetical protein
MAALNKLLLFVGATALAILVEQMSPPAWLLVTVIVVSYSVAALVAWRERWLAAFVAFADPSALRPGAVPDSPRVAALRGLLREAAAAMPDLPRDYSDARAAAEMAWVVHTTVSELLDRAFLVPSTEDYRRFLAAERDKQLDGFDPRQAARDFLARLADRITEDAIDPGFLIPDSFAQFRAANEGADWPANVR